MVGVSDLNHLMDEDSFFSYVSDGQTFNTKGGRSVRSTASINGGEQYFATSHAVSDILQGALLDTNPQDNLLVINRALTNQLKGLPDEITSYSSFTQTIPEISLKSGGGGTGTNPGFGDSGNLDPAWVKALPLVHSDGPVIWAGQGKSSNEMHLPTSASIEEDIAQHRQSSTLKDFLRHPFNMDRVGGPIGGESEILYDISDGPVRLVGDDSNKEGQTGAFGYLDPESEQWYISMAWPYKSDGVTASFLRAGLPAIATLSATLSKSQYKGKRLLVYCPAVGRAVVATPGDWGTQPYWSNGAVTRESINGFYYGLSPDIHDALGTNHGADMVVRWMPDTTPLGPYQPNADQVVSSGSYNGVSNSASGSTLVNSLEELIYAGEMISNHPGMAQAQYKDRLVDGFQLQFGGANQTPARPAIWFPSINRGFHYPSLLNYLWYLLEAGYSFSGSVAGYVNKYTSGGSISNHAYGGAIDIMGIGAPGHAPVRSGHPQWMAFCESAFNYLATLARETKPAEIGGDFNRLFNGWLKVYTDAAHIHFGFDQTQIGQLISALKVNNNNSSAANGYT
jgi:hypothetical protein